MSTMTQAPPGLAGPGGGLAEGGVQGGCRGCRDS